MQYTESLPNEIWKDVVGYEGLYKISNLSRILCCGSGKQKRATYSKNNSHFLNQQTNKAGYKKILLTNGDKRKTYMVSRLVAIAFIPNPLNKPQVNHIDGVRSNNVVENLEWAISSENILHSFNVLNKVSCWKGMTRGKHHCSKKIKLVNTGVVYDSIISAALDNNVLPSTLSGYTKLGKFTCKKMQWEMV